MEFKFVLNKLSSKCPHCNQHLWPTRIKYDPELSDAVKKWYQYSSPAKYCSQCNIRLKSKTKLSTFYILFILIIVPFLNAVIAPATIKAYGLAFTILLAITILLFILWLNWFGEEYEIYGSDQ